MCQVFFLQIKGLAYSKEAMVLLYQWFSTFFYLRTPKQFCLSGVQTPLEISNGGVDSTEV